ncbi:vancomycin high temperature exclusion protein [Streptomyces sp. NPDC020379]|uniref:vancomycin high temperature exclusion protein n=1 Tax=Streptomyces sp. NPDC020379 TaxID=3365071 RepID=UPI0037A40755
MGRPLPRTTVGRRRALWAAMAGCLLAPAPVTWGYASATPRVRSLADVPDAPVAMVFGAGPRDGEPSPYLAHRLDAAVELYRAGKVKAVLVTGDNSGAAYDEPDAMRACPTARGMPDSRVVSDFAGFDTWDSCTRAVRVRRVREAVLIGQGFPIRRAPALCGAAGIEAYGVGAAADAHDLSWYAGGAREVLAAGKAAVAAPVRPGPRFLGPREPGLSRAPREER